MVNNMHYSDDHAPNCAGGILCNCRVPENLAVTEDGSLVVIYEYSDLEDLEDPACE